MDVERIAQELSDLLARTGPAAPAVLFLGSLVEYVFPPFPGDTLVVLGAWYAVHGVLSWPTTFAAVTAGALAGAWIDYRVGAALGRSLEAGASRRGPLTAERLRHVEEGYRRWGAWFLLANRFLPGVRAFLFVGAGAARIPIGKVLLFGGISAAAWNALLLLVGGLLVGNLGEMLDWVRRYTTVAWVLMGIGLVGLAVAFAVRRAAARSRSRRR
jgi:membrane protein DedA with SNARE-associated domain